MTLVDVKKALISLLKSEYPDYHYYSMAVIEEYDRPAFFTQIKPIEMNYITKRVRENIVVFYINYLQEEVDEADMLNKVDSIRKLFGTNVKVNNRAIDVQSFDFDFIGENKNILDISIELEWKDRIEYNDNSPIMESVEMIIKKMEE